MLAEQPRKHTPPPSHHIADPPLCHGLRLPMQGSLLASLALGWVLKPLLAQGHG